MFTGLIEDIGEIKRISRDGNGLKLDVKTGIPSAELLQGDSIAIDGVCLTVTDFIKNCFTVNVSPESVNRTILGTKKEGGKVNLERALKLSDRLGGHLVTGHIDGTATVTAITYQGEFTKFDFTAPENILKYIIEKGSVAIDGISLTVNQCAAKSFNVMIIPHTFSNTTLAFRKTGNRVNIENDIIGKYVEKFLLKYDNRYSGITKELLEKLNFM
jgi:riboflavin synthase